MYFLRRSIVLPRPGGFTFVFPDTNASLSVTESEAIMLTNLSGVLISNDLAPVLLGQELLSNLIHNDCLVHADTYFSRSSAMTVAATPSVAICVCTRNRLSQLLVTLAEVTYSLTLSERKADLVIIDTTDLLKKEDSNALHEFVAHHRESFLDVTILDHEAIEKAVICGIGLSLRSAGTYAFVPRPGASVTTGASRNLALAVTKGKIAVFVDDDVNITSVYQRPGTTFSTLLTSVARRPELVRVADSADIRNGLVRYHGDVIKELTKGVSKSINSVLHDYDRVECDQLDPPTISALEQGTSGRVIACMSGYYGHPGFSDMTPLGLLSPAQPPDFSMDAGSQVQLQLAATSPLLTKDEFLMTLAAALDNVNYLPPFLPVGRGQDQLFMRVCRRLISGSMTMHLPFMVDHDSKRNVDRSVIHPFQVKLTSLMSLLIDDNMAQAREPDPYRASSVLTSRLLGYCHLSDAALSDLIYERFARWISELSRDLTISSAHSRLQMSRTDQNSCFEALVDCIRRNDWIKHLEVGWIAASPWDDLRTEIRAYCELLGCWDELCLACRDSVSNSKIK